MYNNGSQEHGPVHDVQTDKSSREADMGISFGHDNACDAQQAFELPPEYAATEGCSLVGEKHPSYSDDEEVYFQTAIPTTSDGPTTFAYQLALQNRIKNGKLLKHSEYDMSAYKPTFVHDILMLPGSLANYLGKRHAKNLVPKMTPALLPGFHAYVHAESQQPCVLQSPDATDYVQGMLVFGQGKKARRHIHEHYRGNSRRVTVEVQVDVAVAVPVFERNYPTERWRLKRRVVSAHAWIWSNVGSSDAHLRTQCPRWTPEAYINGDLSPKQPLRIEDAGYLEDEVILIDSDAEEQQEERPEASGGWGSTDYDRGAGFTGW